MSEWTYAEMQAVLRRGLENYRTLTGGMRRAERTALLLWIRSMRWARENAKKKHG